MPAAPLPRDEHLRLAVLRDLDLLDAGPDADLDRLTALAAEVLEVPLCLVSLMDSSQQRILSHHGLDTAQWPREQSFCGHVVASGRAILAHDLRLDDRFADNELVNRRIPALRFYAGMPLVFDGQVVGTLAVLDQRPRHDFDERKLQQLARFTELVHSQLAQHRERRQTQRERTLFASGPVGAIVWDAAVPPKPVYLSANLRDILGEIVVEQLRAGKPFDAIVHPDDQELVETGLNSHALGELPSLEISFRLRQTGRHPRWIHQVSRADRDADGRLVGIRSYLYDLTRQKQLESSIEATKERLYLALESARIGTWDLHYPSQERMLNSRAAAMLGFREDELEHSNMAWMDRVHPFDRVLIERAIQDSRHQRSEVVALEYRIRHKRGHHIWVRSYGRVVEHDRQGRAVRVVGTLIDITEDKQKEALRNHQRQLLDLLNQAQTSFLLNRSVHDACEALFEPLLKISECTVGFIGVVQQGPQGEQHLLVPTISEAGWHDHRVTPGSSHTQREDGLLFTRLDNLFGHAVTANEVVMANHLPSHPASRGLPEGHAELKNFLGLPIRFDHKVVGMIGLGNRPSGFDDPLVQLLEPLVVTLGTLFHARDQETARVTAEQELQRLASRDALTGLSNRRHFFDVAAACLTQTRRYAAPLTVALMDLDHFKHINDTHGHAAGDAVLKVFAEVLRESLRDTDTPARIGGEEFAVLLTSTPQDEAIVALERIRAALDQRAIEFNGQLIYATVSIGAVQWRAEHHDVDAMLAHADEALYSAKRAGRNRVCLYRHEGQPNGQEPPSMRAANDAA